MKLLAIETSGKNCSVALASGDLVYSQEQMAMREQSQLLLKFIDDLLSESKIDINQLDVIAYSRGPGSFTGVRLAASSVQGLALKDDIPVLAISSLQVLAQTAYEKHGCHVVAVCVDAHMGEVYFNIYRLDSQGLMQAKDPDRLLSPAQISLIPGDAEYAVGSGWEVYQKDLPSLLNVKQDLNLLSDAKALIPLARHYFALGAAVSADQGLPNYLRNENAWRKSKSGPL